MLFSCQTRALCVSAAFFVHSCILKCHVSTFKFSFVTNSVNYILEGNSHKYSTEKLIHNTVQSFGHIHGHLLDCDLESTTIYKAFLIARYFISG